MNATEAKTKSTPTTNYDDGCTPSYDASNALYDGVFVTTCTSTFAYDTPAQPSCNADQAIVITPLLLTAIPSAPCDFVADNPIKYTDPTGLRYVFSPQEHITILKPVGQFTITEDDTTAGNGYEELLRIRSGNHHGYQVTYDPYPAPPAKKLEYPCSNTRIRLVQAINVHRFMDSSPHIDVGDRAAWAKKQKASDYTLEPAGYVEGGGMAGSAGPNLSIFDDPNGDDSAEHVADITVCAYDGHRPLGCVTFTYNNKTGEIVVPGVAKIPGPPVHFVVPAQPPSDLIKQALTNWYDESYIRWHF